MTCSSIILMLVSLISMIMADENFTVELEWGTTGHLRCLPENVKSNNDTRLDFVNGSINWKKNNTTVVKIFRGKKTMYTSGVHDLDDDFALVIYDVDYNSQGLYQCRYSTLKPSGHFRVTRVDATVKASPLRIEDCSPDDHASSAPCDRYITEPVVNVSCTKRGAKVPPKFRAVHGANIRVMSEHVHDRTSNGDGSFTAGVRYELEIGSAAVLNFTCILVDDNGKRIESALVIMRPENKAPSTGRTVGLSVGSVLVVIVIVFVLVLVYRLCKGNTKKTDEHSIEEV